VSSGFQGFHGFAIDPAIDLTIRIALAIVLGFAAFRKIADFPAFRTALEGYRILPTAAVGAAAVSIIVLEKVAAVGLIVFPLRGPFEILAAALFAVYGVAITVNLARGRSEIDCGCGGASGRQTLHPALLLRNFALVVAALMVGIPESGRTLGAVDLITVLGGTAVLVFLYRAADGLIAGATRNQVAQTPEGVA
jgi:hypothetical protein